MNIRAVVFDMDGLMFDTENLTYKLQHEILLRDFGFDYTLEDYKLTVGKRTADLIGFFKSLCPEGFDYEEFRAACRESFTGYTDKNGVPVKDGLFELLDLLKERKIKIALATSTTFRSASRTLKIAGTLDYFDELVCAEDVKNGKPDPEPFLKAAQKLKTEPCECIALEDSFNGIRSANAAGMAAVMVPDMIEPTEEIRSLCKAVEPSLREVAKMIRENLY